MAIDVDNVKTQITIVDRAANLLDPQSHTALKVEIRKQIDRDMRVLATPP